LDAPQPSETRIWDDGQPRDFAELYRHNVTRIYRYALSRVGNVDDAQDLTAQTFAAALRGFSQFRGEGSVAAWLTSIARNLAISQYRARRPTLPLDENVASMEQSPENIAGQRLRLQAVLDALATLPDEHAEVVRLRIFSELSTAETAAAMGKSEAAVKMTLHRALQTLRERAGADEVETSE
jgi:RNA polymerase sigma-70 factor (ECF subfamily)